MANPIIQKEDAERKKRINEHLKNADKLLRAADPNSALSQVEDALLLDPNNYYALAYKGRILEAIKEKTSEAAPVQPAPPPPAPAVHTPVTIPTREPESPSVQEDVSVKPIAPVKREFQRKLAAIMFTDMVNYTAITQKNEPLAIQLLEKHRKILRPIFKQFDGEEIKTIGDAFLVEFVSVFQAVKCAIAIQNAIADYNLPVGEDRRILIRIGVHIGDVIYQEEDIIGDGVNLAARIQERAAAGGICVSQDVYNQIRMREDIHTEDMGEITLKNVLTPVRLYKVYTSDEAYRKAEEKAIESAKGEGRKNALNAVVNKYLERSNTAFSQNDLEEAMRKVFGVLAIDANNEEGKAVLEKIRVERAKDFAKSVEEARTISRDTLVDLYRRLLKRSWSDGSLSSVELTLLDNVRSSFQITNDEHREYEREAQKEIYTALLHKYLKIVQPSGEETDHLAMMKEDLSISDSEHAAIESKYREEHPLNTF